MVSEPRVSIELLAIYADESCLGNGRPGENPGGAGAVIEYRARGAAQVVRRDLWVSEPSTTNNRMALRSVTETMQAIGGKGAHFQVLFTTDSRYIVDGMTEWVFGWARRGWTRKGGAIENLALWHKAINAANDHAVRWNWVRGHNGHAQNEYANHLATRAAAEQNASDGLVESNFENWLALARTKRATCGEPSPFPHQGTFRPHASLPSPNG